MKFVRPSHVLHKLPLIILSGLSSAMVELANAITVFFFNTQILAYSTELAVSIYGIICNWGILFMSLFNGIGLAIQPVISRNFGAGLLKRASITRNLALICAAIFGLIFFLAGFLFTRPLITLFVAGTPEIFAISDTAVHLYFTAFLFMGITLVLTYYFQSTLWNTSAFVCSLCRSILFASTFVFLLPKFLGLNGIWASYPCGEIAALVLTLILFILQQRKLAIVANN